MTSPNIKPSNEVSLEAFTNFVITRDWKTQFRINDAGLRALSVELAEEQDPERVADLAMQKHEALICTVGAGGLSLFTDDVLAEQADFEAEFGESW